MHVKNSGKTLQIFAHPIRIALHDTSPSSAISGLGACKAKLRFRLRQSQRREPQRGGLFLDDLWLQGLGRSGRQAWTLLVAFEDAIRFDIFLY